MEHVEQDSVRCSVGGSMSMRDAFSCYRYPVCHSAGPHATLSLSQGTTSQTTGGNLPHQQETIVNNSARSSSSEGGSWEGAVVPGEREDTDTSTPDGVWETCLSDAALERTLTPRAQILPWISPQLEALKKGCVLVKNSPSKALDGVFVRISSSAFRNNRSGVILYPILGKWKYWIARRGLLAGAPATSTSLSPTVGTAEDPPDEEMSPGLPAPSPTAPPVGDGAGTRPDGADKHEQAPSPAPDQGGHHDPDRSASSECPPAESSSSASEDDTSFLNIFGNVSRKRATAFCEAISKAAMWSPR